ncbi:anthranilate phosphoribosyltransferase [Buchnera aphidicola (Taiwanaphis decaspermi)]|uniref:anthranilate phosphoribosyltransferase n=1 Tax=Buchnera aphidicola TaxID=9 RepID=UPI0031B84B33
MKIILKKIYNSNNLNISESYKLFNYLNKNNNVQEIYDILTNLNNKNIYPEEIVGAVKYFLNFKYYKSYKKNNIFADIVGTGGDKSNSINISTISSIVSSSLGFKISKHCNKGITSKVGSANLLKYLGFNLYLTHTLNKKLLDEFNLCFLYHPNYYKKNQNILLARKKINKATIFNIIGPLINPLKPKYLLIGVYKIKMLPIIANTLKLLGYKRALVVHGKGMDEIINHGITHVAEIKKNKIIYYEISPKDFGLKLYPEYYENKNNLIEASNILQGKSSKHYIELISMNVAMLLKLFGFNNLKENTSKILKFIYDGYTYKHMIAMINKQDLYEQK